MKSVSRDVENDTLDFGTLPDGRLVKAYGLQAPGIRASILNYGATLQSLQVKNPDGSWTETVLGFDSLAGYLAPHPYIGAAIGRVAGRISQARFTIDGHAFSVPNNEGPNALHSGPDGFDRQVWTVQRTAGGLSLEHVSLDGHQGYPGVVTARYHFALSDAALTLWMRATTTAPTPVNLTHHSYFNLSGKTAEKRDARGHRLRVMADHYLPTDHEGLPRGGYEAVEGTAYDLRADVKAGARVSDHRALDHNFHSGQSGVCLPRAELQDPASGRRLTVLSDLPDIQVFTGAALAGTAGREGQVYGANAGIALEPQFPPNAVNTPTLADIILRPGEVYERVIVYRFGQALRPNS